MMKRAGCFSDGSGKGSCIPPSTIDMGRMISFTWSGMWRKFFRELCRTLISMAKQSLAELYQWTGEKVETASFQVTDMGSVYFGMTPEDIRRSRIFYSRSFGTDTAYNLSNYDKSISSMYVTSGRSVWYSPVLWRVFPENPGEMTQEEIIAWYLERTPLAQEIKVKRMERSFGDTWTVQTQNDLWFEVGYNAGLKEVTDVTGPYSEIPVH